MTDVLLECLPAVYDGKFSFTKLVYEIGDPANYILPDVICDFSNVKIEPIVGTEGISVLRKVLVLTH